MRILVVDDAAILRTLFIRIVTSLGHSVVGEADSLAGALASAHALAPDAIVLDGRLCTDLSASVTDLRQAAPHSAVLIVAASDEAVPARLVREGRSGGLIRRPFSRSGIRDVLIDCEASHRAERA